MVSAIISRIVILLFGTLYPAYASYKAVRTKNVKEYVKWMMYWIVFALFCSVETFSDVFLSWLPFYYELKIVFVLWMLSPMTQGSSFLFKKFVHPQLVRREKEIDEMIAQASKQGYTTLLSLGSKSISYASQFMMRTAIMGQSKLVDHLRRSYSTSDLSNDGQGLLVRHNAIGEEEGEDELDNRLREDNAELEVLANSKTKLSRSKSSAGTSTGYSLSSLKEEAEGEGEEEEKVITETYTIPVSTKKHYTIKEGSKSGQHATRCQSLPPFSGFKRVPGAYVTKSPVFDAKAKEGVRVEGPSRSQFENESKSSVPVPRIVELKRNLFSRSHSQDNIIIRRGKDQVLMGLSSERKRKLLQRAQSEAPTLLKQTGSHKFVSPLATQDNQSRSRYAEELAKEAFKIERASELSKHVILEGELKSDISNTLKFEDAILTREDPDVVALETSHGQYPIGVLVAHENCPQEFKSDASEWHYVDGSDKLIRSIDSSGSELIFIDAEDRGDERSVERDCHPVRDSFSPSPQMEGDVFEDCFDKTDPTESLPNVNLVFVSQFSDSEDEDTFSISDSSETLRSLTPENRELDWISESDEEEIAHSFVRSLRPQALQKASQALTNERALESGSKSLPCSPSLPRGLWLEDIEEECQQSASTPSIPCSQLTFPPDLARQPSSKLKGERKVPCKNPLWRQASEPSRTSASFGTFDPFRSQTSYHVPSFSTITPAVPLSHSAPKLPYGQSAQRLYRRSHSLDSRDSWFHTYPKTSVNVGSFSREQANIRSTSVERDTLPLHVLRKLSQDPSQMNLKAKK